MTRTELHQYLQAMKSSAVTEEEFNIVLDTSMVSRGPLESVMKATSSYEESIQNE